MPFAPQRAVVDPAWSAIVALKIGPVVIAVLAWAAMLAEPVERISHMPLSQAEPSQDRIMAAIACVGAVVIPVMSQPPPWGRMITLPFAPQFDGQMRF